MYAGETPFPSVGAHRARYGSTHPKFRDVGQGTVLDVAGPAWSSRPQPGNGPNRQMDPRSDRQASGQPSHSIWVSWYVARNMPDREDTNR